MTLSRAMADLNVIVTEAMGIGETCFGTCHHQGLQIDFDLTVSLAPEVDVLVNAENT